MMEESLFIIGKYSDGWTIATKQNIEGVDEVIYSKSVFELSTVVKESANTVISMAYKRYHGTFYRSSLLFKTVEDANLFIAEYLEPKYIMNQITK